MGYAVQADDERVSESGLVGRVGRVQGQVGGFVCVRRECGQGLRRQRLRQIRRRQVVRRLVRCGQEGLGRRVRAVVRDPAGPAQAVQAGEEGAVGLFGGRGVEGVQERGRRGPGLRRYGKAAGELGETVRRQRGSSSRVWCDRGCGEGCGVTLSGVVMTCPTLARISPERESFGTGCGLLGVPRTPPHPSLTLSARFDRAGAVRLAE